MITIPNLVQEFENGCKVRLDVIDPDIDVYLWLPEEGKYRFCGQFNPDDGIFFVKRFTDHRHRALNAFGISDYAIRMLEPLGLKSFLMLIEDTKEYFESTLENAKEHAIWKYWREKGFDRQLFLPVPRWERKK